MTHLSPDNSRHETVSSTEAEWILAYEQHVMRSAHAPGEPPHSLSDDERQRLLHAKRGLDALQRAFGNATKLEAATEVAHAGELGDFRILNEIGRGGMGIVYQAEQISLGRRVALKVLPMAGTLSAGQRQRFSNEARAAAALKHPHIVGVYSVGIERGVHYYAMELVDGQSLGQVVAQLGHKCGDAEKEKNSSGEVEQGSGGVVTPRCNGYSTTPLLHSYSACDTSPDAHVSTLGSIQGGEFWREVARLGAQAADALEYAHQMGVVHRDIKPSNLLVDEAGKLWVTDFGLAMTQSDNGLTMTGDLLGTLRYMSPEQLAGKRLPLDHRTDIYSLGTTLYELLASRPAFDSADRARLVREISEIDPPPLRRLNPSVPVDLETIVSKAMEKVAADRYASAKDFARDLQRYLEHRPIMARPATPLQRAAKWSRRHHALVAVAGIAVVALTAVLSVATILIERSRAQMEVAFEEADQHRNRMADLLYVADVRMAAQALKDNDVSRATELLERQVPSDGREDRRDLEWYFLFHRCVAGHEKIDSTGTPIYDFAFSPDGAQLVTVGKDALLRIFQWPSRRPIGKIETGQLEVNGVAFSPDGRAIATTGDDGTLKLWRDSLETAAHTIRSQEEIAFSVVYSKAVDCFITCGDNGSIRLWDANSGEPKGALDGHKEQVTALAVSHNGKLLASAGRDETVRLWDLVNRRQRHWMQGSGRATSLAFDSRDEALIVGKFGDFWDPLAFVRVDDFQRYFVPTPTQRVDSVALSPDRRLLAAGCANGAICLWWLNEKTLRHKPDAFATWKAHAGRIYRLGFTPDGQDLISTGEDGEVFLWKKPEGRFVQGLSDYFGEVRDFAPVGQSTLLAVASQTGVHILDATTREVVHEIAYGQYRSVDVSHDGMRIAANDVLGKITIWSLESAAPVAIGSIAFGEEWGDVSFSPDGSTLAVTASAIDDGLTLVDLRTHKKRSEFVSHGCRDFTWSPDGRYFAAAENHTNDVLVCNGSSGQLVWRLNGHTSSIESVAFSPDSRLLASVDDTRRILLWGVDHGSEIWSATDSSITNKRGSPDSLVFTPSGRTLMSLSSAGVIGAWHVATGRELFQLDDTMRASSCLTLCNEGRYICMWRVGRLCVLETGLPPESIADDAAPNIVSP